MPRDEKPKARDAIRDILKFIRENAHSKNVVITPRTNGLTTGLFHDDVRGVLNKETSKYING